MRRDLWPGALLPGGFDREAAVPNGASVLRPLAGPSTAPLGQRAEAAPGVLARASWTGFIEAMLDAVLLVDRADLGIVAANRRACELLGGSVGELCRHAIARFAPTPEDLCFWSEAARGLSDAIESETQVMTLGGVLLPVLRRVGRVDAEDGRTLFAVVLHDRSAQVRAERELEAALADLRATLESTCDGLLVTDLEGRIRHFNQRFARLWRIPGAMLVRRDDDAILEWMRRRVTDPAAYMRRLAQIDAGSLPEVRDLLALTDGGWFERVASLQCLHGRPVGRVYAFREATGALDLEGPAKPADLPLTAS